MELDGLWIQVVADSMEVDPTSMESMLTSMEAAAEHSCCREGTGSWRASRWCGWGAEGSAGCVIACGREASPVGTVAACYGSESAGCLTVLGKTERRRDGGQAWVSSSSPAAGRVLTSSTMEEASSRGSSVDGSSSSVVAGASAAGVDSSAGLASASMASW